MSYKRCLTKDVLQKLSKEIDRTSLEIIYHTFVRSKMEYACIVWDDCSEQNYQVLENCQLRATRIITGAKKGTSHNKLYAETQWPELEEKRSYLKLCFMHKVVHKSAIDCLVDVLPNVANAEKHYNLRNSDDLDQFTFKTEKFRKSLFPDCVRKWNILDKDIRAVVSRVVKLLLIVMVIVIVMKHFGRNSNSNSNRLRKIQE